MHRVNLALAFVCLFLLDAPLPRPPPPLPPLPEGPAVAACDGVAADLTAVTWNTGLGPGMVSHSTPRAPHVAEAIAASDFDVLCLQEVWTAPDQARILGSLGLSPRRVLTFDTTDLQQDAAARCDRGGLTSLAACAQRECGDVPVEEQTLCALRSCERQLLGIYLSDRECLDCLTAGVGKSVREIVRTCENEGMSRVYDGRNGIILASRWRLYDKDVMVLPATGANRVALFARVDVPGRGPVELACTHISSPQRISPRRSGFDDWQDEQSAQVRLIAERLRERASDGVPQLFLGDINAGPALGDDIFASSSRVWDEVVRLGFTSPAADLVPPFCSVCRENSLRGGAPGKLIDHALVFDPPGGATLAPRCIDRPFDAPVTVTGPGGERIRTHLSDHYGVRVRFDLR